MKTVFRSDEIAHIWANEGAPHGRSPGNASFDGDAFKSYATVIGNRVRHGGKVAYVLDRASFSNSTSKVQGRLAQAVRDADKRFDVRCGRRGQYLTFTPATLRDHYLSEAKKIEAREPSRYAFKRAEQYHEVTAEIEHALEVCTYFGLGTAKLTAVLVKREQNEGHAADIMAERGKAMLEATKRKDARELRERTARNVAYVTLYIKQPATDFVDLAQEERALVTLPAELRAEYIAKVGVNNAALADNWRAGHEVRLPYNSPTMLRAEGDEMVTSHGARVLLVDAAHSYAFARKVRATGWRRNGETHKVGPYQLDAVNGAGIVAGCHRLTWEECDRFAALMGWSVATVNT